MWSSYYLVACGLVLEVANILWKRAGRSMVLLLAPAITSIGVWQFDFAWQIKLLLTFLAVGLHIAVFTWGRQHLAELRKAKMKTKEASSTFGVSWSNKKWIIWTAFALLSLVTLASLIQANWWVAGRADGWVWVDGKLDAGHRLYSRWPGVVFVQSDTWGYMFLPDSTKAHVVYRHGLHETPWALYCDDELQVQPAEYEPLGDWIPNMKEVETKYGMATVFTTIDGKRVRFVVDYR